MANKPTDAQSLRAIHEIFSPEELRALCQRIIGSGVLGRSKNYGAMLSYLVRCSIDDKSPKELELAIDVLGRGRSEEHTSELQSRSDLVCRRLFVKKT